MSGNAKQRRVFRRKLEREGLYYVPPCDYRRRLYDRNIYLEMPPFYSTMHMPPPPGLLEAWARIGRWQ